MRPWLRDLSVIVLAAAVAVVSARIASPEPAPVTQVSAPTPTPVVLPPADDARIEALEKRVAVLEQQPPVPPVAALALTPDGGTVAGALLGELAAMRADTEKRRSERREDQLKRATETADLELVKLQAAQNRFTLEQTTENVRRRLVPLGIEEARLKEVLPTCTQHVRARSDALIELLQRVSSGQHVTRAEAEQTLAPLSKNLEGQLSALDPLTRKAVVTELSKMVRLPILAFARE